MLLARYCWWSLLLQTSWDNDERERITHRIHACMCACNVFSRMYEVCIHRSRAYYLSSYSIPWLPRVWPKRKMGWRLIIARLVVQTISLADPLKVKSHPRWSTVRTREIETGFFQSAGERWTQSVSILVGKLVNISVLLSISSFFHSRVRTVGGSALLIAQTAGRGSILLGSLTRKLDVFRLSVKLQLACGGRSFDKYEG